MNLDASKTTNSLLRLWSHHPVMLAGTLPNNLWNNRKKRLDLHVHFQWRFKFTFLSALKRFQNEKLFCLTPCMACGRELSSSQLKSMSKEQLRQIIISISLGLGQSDWISQNYISARLSLWSNGAEGMRWTLFKSANWFGWGVLIVEHVHQHNGSFKSSRPWSIPSNRPEIAYRCNDSSEPQGAEISQPLF